MKKLKLNDLKIHSFRTSDEDANQIKGGTIRPTAASCLDYISCSPLQCLISRNGPICLEH
ncbi:MAG: pinensin family lanthipeptide [Bacteroidota bacterium]